MDSLKQKMLLAAVVLVTVFIPATTHAAFSDIFDLLNPFAAPAEAEETVSFPVAKDREPIRILTVIATAYSSDPNQTDDTPCNPAMWKFDLCEAYLEQGLEDTIAANFLPLGTKVQFPDLYGDKIFTVRDRMNARYNYDRLGYYRIDFYKAEATTENTMDHIASKQEAIQFGIKRGLKMEVLAYVK